ncbi:MAG: hydroxyacylglutathione hydrolase [Pseudomonadota bacterium]
MAAPQFEILTVACLSDNYAFLIHERESKRTALVDAPEAKPILAALDVRGWQLDDILLTHHHYDHVDAVPALKERFNARVHGARADIARLPSLDAAYEDGDIFDLYGAPVTVLDVSGHTVGHIAFHLPAAHAAFTADSLMALGCGRLFEGTPAQMWESLLKLRALPDDTVIYSGHEYTQANGRFAVTVDPDNADLAARIAEIAKLRDSDLPTVPSTLSLEIATNPFLRADDPNLARNVDLEGADPAEVFAEIRKRKDNF